MLVAELFRVLAYQKIRSRVRFAEAARPVVGSGDKHLLGMGRRLPLYSPVGFCQLLELLSIILQRVETRRSPDVDASFRDRTVVIAKSADLEPYPVSDPTRFDQ